MTMAKTKEIGRALTGPIRGINGNVSLGRVLTFAGMVFLCTAFNREARTNGLVWQDYIAFATAMTILYAPARAIDLIRAIKGTDIPAPTIETVPEVK